MKRKGKTIALSVTAAGFLVLVAAGVASKDRIWEEWYLRKLESGNEAEQAAAANILGNMHSVLAAPILASKLNDRLLKARGFVPPVITYNTDSPDKMPQNADLIFKNALVKIGRPATLPLLEVAKKAEWEDSTLYFGGLLSQIYPCPKDNDQHWREGRTISCDEFIFLSLRDDPASSPDVQKAATAVLEKCYGIQDGILLIHKLPQSGDPTNDKGAAAEETEEDSP